MSNDNDETAPGSPPATTARGADAREPSSPAPGGRGPLEVAHVLFMDIVGYSTLLLDQQPECLGQLQHVVSGTTEFRGAQAAGRLISLPTGDGMALVFFNDPEAPLRCAVEIARALREHAAIGLRMGIHSGPVYRIADINANKNVAGGGINVAQRVMDCGDAGHILLSKRVADDLGQISRWAAHIHHLGEVEVKHGVRLHISNFYTDDVGRAEMPRRFAPDAGAALAPPARRHLLRRPAVAIALLLLLAAAVAGSAVWLSRRPSSPDVRNADPDGGATEHVINYWIVVQKYRRGQPNEAPFRLSGEMGFEPNDRMRMFFVSPQAGHLYLINEGPVPVAGRPDFNLLFPTPTANRGLSVLSPGQPVQVPEGSWLVFDRQRGSELIWVIWSAQRLEELEGLKALVTPRDRGVISEPAHVESVRKLLARAAEVRVSTVGDGEGAQTKLAGDGNLLIYPLRLKHR